MKHFIKAIILSSLLSNVAPAFAADFKEDDSKPQNLVRFDLGGQWQVSASGSNDWFGATVPGCIHTDLLAAKRIPDPFYGENEKAVQWVGKLGWTYRRKFEVTDQLLKREHLLLRCEGLDTLATVLVNGVELGRADNMYRLWEFDVKPLLKPGSNSIEIRFASVLPYIRAKERERHIPTWQYPGAAYIRKMPCNFGWDWGPTLITCGIWRNISLVGFDVARLEDVQILQDHSHKDKVTLTVNVSAGMSGEAALKAKIVVVSSEGKCTKALECPLTNGIGAVELTINHPELWWPAGMGAQPLYKVLTELLDSQGRLLDTVQRRIGLRTLQVLEQTDSTPMQFVVNGVPFFAKGANWIPADAFPTRLTEAQLRRYIADAAACNMNTLRFWGGGYYEDDALFDACDEMGICVWLDFKFACSTYPVFNTNFLANVREEATEQVKRLRHHPSIGVWCGNNEIMFLRGGSEWAANKMSAPDYYLLFRDTLGGVVHALSPQSAYVTGSPDCGDVHFWKVWHGGQPFEAYRDIHGFMSEFGFQSFADPATIAAFTAPEDRTNVYSPMIKHHERNDRSSVDSPDDGTIGTDKIMKMVRLNFREPKDFESTLWLSQINQAYGIEIAAESWRREMPRSMGCVFWQYNDDWPCTSWSSVDYFGRWKALQYRARHFYSPILISGVFDPKNHAVALWLTSDKLKPVAGNLKWRVTDLAGTELSTGNQSVAVNPQQSAQVDKIEMAGLLQQYGASNLLVWLSFEVNGHMASQNLVLLVRPKELELHNPELNLEISGSGTNYNVTVRAKCPALWTWLDLSGLDARFSDNFVSVSQDAGVQFKIQLDKPMEKKDFVNHLRVRSLFETYNHQIK